MGENRGPSTSINRLVEWVDTDAAGQQHSPRVQQVVNFRDRLWFGREITATIWAGQLGERA